MAMKEAAIRGEVQATAEVVSSYAWFRDARELLDLGGTHGLYAIAFADKNPELKATLFDFPGVPGLGNAQEHIEEYGVTGRVTIQEGDFMGGDIGNGYDAVFISHVYLQGDVLDLVLRRIHDALNCDGRFVLKNCVIPKNRNGSFATSLVDLDMCFLSDEHQMHSIDEYADLIEPYGFVIEDVAMIEECSYCPSAILMFRKEA
ncbi:MAG: methyltransferase [Euryarchaeota archaeon]|nr:methyltransferase [Euryarchaeota archaeon]